MRYLNDIWAIYFHDPFDHNWEISSYKLISTISSVEEFVEIFSLYEDMFYNGMFFLMREHITPRWEDEYNKEGGCFSFKISKFLMQDKLFELFSQTIGETIGKTKSLSNNINGVSICPKKNYYIIRIWIKDSAFAGYNNYNITVPKYSTIMYKHHSEK
jgi:hypothetical protein